MTRKFMITGLLAAGFGHPDPLQASVTRVTSNDRPDEGNLFQLFRQEHMYTLAGHSSHRSHSSHSSHVSHSSGSGGHASHYSSTGGYSSPPAYNPAPFYTPPSPSPSTQSQPMLESSSPPAEAKPTPLPGRSALFKRVVMRVQVALMGRGFFDGPLDGNVGPKTRAALREFQQSKGLSVTGTITAETLDALHVPGQ